MVSLWTIAGLWNYHLIIKKMCRMLLIRLHEMLMVSGILMLGKNKDKELNSTWSSDASPSPYRNLLWSGRSKEAWREWRKGAIASMFLFSTEKRLIIIDRPDKRTWAFLCLFMMPALEREREMECLIWGSPKVYFSWRQKDSLHGKTSHWLCSWS